DRNVRDLWQRGRRTPKLVPRQCGSSASKPGQIDRHVIAGCLAGQQLAPGFDRLLGFANVREKRLLAVEAAPTSGIKQFGEIFEALVSNVAPAADDSADFGEVWLR